MKYIEELIPGSVFVKDEKIFLLTIDHKKDGSKLAFCLENGNPFWMKANDIVDTCPIFKLDKDNNVIPINNLDTQAKDVL